MPVALRFDDPDETFAAVRLASDLPLSDEQRSFARNGDGWVLELELPDVLRLEYKLEVEHPDGGDRARLRPGQPEARARGVRREVRARAAGLRRRRRGWRPRPSRAGPTSSPSAAAGSARTSRSASGARRTPSPAGRCGCCWPTTARSTTRCPSSRASARRRSPPGELPPFRVALLAPGDRDQWYSASAAYSRVLAHDIVPALRETFGVIGAPAGMGASLGGLAMLHAQRRFPRALGGLFLQSGSFFMPRYDAHERRFSRYVADRALRARHAPRRRSTPCPCRWRSRSAARRRTRTTIARWRVPWPHRGTTCPWRRFPTCTTTSAGGTHSTRI